MGHAQIHKERMKGDDPEIDTAQTQQCLDGHMTLLEKLRKTFIDSIPNKGSQDDISYMMCCTSGRSSYIANAQEKLHHTKYAQDGLLSIKPELLYPQLQSLL